MGNDWQGGGANPVYNWIWRRNLVRILSTAKLEGRANRKHSRADQRNRPDQADGPTADQVFETTDPTSGQQQEE